MAAPINVNQPPAFTHPINQEDGALAIQIGGKKFTIYNLSVGTDRLVKDGQLTKNDAATLEKIGRIVDVWLSEEKIQYALTLRSDLSSHKFTIKQAANKKVIYEAPGETKTLTAATDLYDRILFASRGVILPPVGGGGGKGGAAPPIPQPIAAQHGHQPHAPLTIELASVNAGIPPPAAAAAATAKAISPEKFAFQAKLKEFEESVKSLEAAQKNLNGDDLNKAKADHMSKGYDEFYEQYLESDSLSDNDRYTRLGGTYENHEKILAEIDKKLNAEGFTKQDANAHNAGAAPLIPPPIASQHVQHPHVPLTVELAPVNAHISAPAATQTAVNAALNAQIDAKHSAAAAQPINTGSASTTTSAPFDANVNVRAQDLQDPETNKLLYEVESYIKNYQSESTTRFAKIDTLLNDIPDPITLNDKAKVDNFVEAVKGTLRYIFTLMDLSKSIKDHPNMQSTVASLHNLVEVGKADLKKLSELEPIIKLYRTEMKELEAAASPKPSVAAAAKPLKPMPPSTPPPPEASITPSTAAAGSPEASTVTSEQDLYIKTLSKEIQECEASLKHLEEQIKNANDQNKLNQLDDVTQTFYSKYLYTDKSQDFFLDVFAGITRSTLSDHQKIQLTKQVSALLKRVTAVREQADEKIKAGVAATIPAAEVLQNDSLEGLSKSLEQHKQLFESAMKVLKINVDTAKNSKDDAVRKWLNTNTPLLDRLTQLQEHIIDMHKAVSEMPTLLNDETQRKAFKANLEWLGTYSTNIHIGHVKLRNSLILQAESHILNIVKDFEEISKYIDNANDNNSVPYEEL